MALKSFISVVITVADNSHNELIEQLNNCDYVKEIIVNTNTTENYFSFKKISAVIKGNFYNTNTLKEISSKIKTSYVLFALSQNRVRINNTDLIRVINIAHNTRTGMIYSDYIEESGEQTEKHPTIDYQTGSLRDDFDFGKMFLIKTSLLKSYTSYLYYDYRYAGLYDLRLFISRHDNFLRIPEFLYSSQKLDARSSGEKQFDYVDPKNRNVQIEMEKAVTDHLKKIGAYLEPDFPEIDYDKSNFVMHASVIIPVKNRAQTIGEAINSALAQKTDFEFNVIVVDNYSDDGTTEIITKLSADNNRIIHLIPEQKDLNIGGCWNLGVNHPRCGMFSVQLDSDDLYINEFTLQKIVDKFHEEKCAMVIGSYTMTDFELNELPPGIISHDEWTAENGHNNGLRINGFGAPRAFYTPLVREIGFPNTSYGEDYSVTLAVSRQHKIGRIYDSLYLCRRWKGNTDSDLSIEQVNKNNFYKDRIRSLEIITRQNMLTEQ